MVACIIDHYGCAVFVEPVMKFFVDGVEIHHGLGREPDRELEEEVWVSEESFVDVEDRFGVGVSMNVAANDLRLF